MPTIAFRIHYRCDAGHFVAVQLRSAEFPRPLPLQSLEDGWWGGAFVFDASLPSLDYSYALIDAAGAVLVEESTPVRHVDVGGRPFLELRDSWLAGGLPRFFFSKAFVDCCCSAAGIASSAGDAASGSAAAASRPAVSASSDTASFDDVDVVFTLHESRLPPGTSVGVVGSIPALGSWAPERSIPLAQVGRTTFTAQCRLPRAALPVEYKYVFCVQSVAEAGAAASPAAGASSAPSSRVWEGGGNRSLAAPLLVPVTQLTPAELRIVAARDTVRAGDALAVPWSWVNTSSSWPVETADVSALPALVQVPSPAELERERRTQSGVGASAHAAAAAAAGSREPFAGAAAAAAGDRLAVCVTDCLCALERPLAWRAAGLQVPLFALRSDSGMGTGEFADLPALVDWCVSAGFRTLHLLPLNDTTATNSADDSSPLLPVSAFALHPLYANLDAAAQTVEACLAGAPAATASAAGSVAAATTSTSGTGSGAAAGSVTPSALAAGGSGGSGGGVPAHIKARIAATRSQLNGQTTATGSSGGVAAATASAVASDHVGSHTSRDAAHAFNTQQRSPLAYEAVVRAKNSLLRDLFRVGGDAVLASPQFASWFRDNRDWLQPYAVFCLFRDLHGSARPETWGARATVTQQQLQSLTDPSQFHYKAVSYAYFVQFILHTQLAAAAAHARAAGVVMVVDVPPAMPHWSADAWVHPSLFKRDLRLGAPPDAFSPQGQVFPYVPYQWDAHRRMDFAWWARRLQVLRRYFDGVRLLHVTEYFRSFEVSAAAITACSGVFSPAKGVPAAVLQRMGADIERMLQPELHEWTLRAALGPAFAALAPRVFRVLPGGRCVLQEAFNSEAKLAAALTDSQWERYLQPLAAMLSNVCFVLHPSDAAAAMPTAAALLSAPLSASLTTPPASSGGGAFATGAATAASGAPPGGAASADPVVVAGPSGDMVITPSTMLHPQFTMPSCTSFLELGDRQRMLVRRCYDAYFGDAQQEAWREVGYSRLLRLQALAGGALTMCDDLGAPAYVSNAAAHAGFVGTRCHQVPTAASMAGVSAAGGDAGVPTEYFAAAAPSTPDLPPLRSWWEADAAVAHKFLAGATADAAAPASTGGSTAASSGGGAATSAACTPAIAREVIARYLTSPSLLVVLPLADALAISGALQNPDPNERINIPAVSRHIWRWRMHPYMEELRASRAGVGATAALHSMIEAAGRFPTK